MNHIKKISYVLADTTSRNELEKHLRLILKDIENLTGNIILFITDLYLIFDAKQIEDHDKLHSIIGPRTLSKYRTYNETNPIFEEYFQYVLVKETSVNDCISILRGVKLLILDLSLVTAAELTNRYIPNPYSPEKTIENKHRQGQLLIEVVGPDAIIEKVSRMTGIASSKLSKTENDRLLTLRDHLYKKIIGQNDAIHSVVKVIQNRARFGKPNKPIGLFLFLGSNSVGKTELAKTLALELFDSTEKLISIDMNKYTTSNSIAQLFDSSFEGMRQQPYAVILFNQIEKVHPQFWNNLSQVLDHNHSLNEKHVNVDLTNTILIFKSNVVAQIILEKSENFLLTNVKFDEKMSQTIKDFVIKNVVLHFPKNFIRHVNDVVFFQPLTYNQLSSIIQLQVISIEERFKEKNIKISLTNKAIQSILQKSYKLFSGVGPVKDHIEKHITSYLSTVVSHGHIRIDTDVNDQYQLSIEK
ncbi:unnamed protein product [Rotaria sordida]|uniref:Clp ATPase C-terminal domain-containing protein n=1 Tax=Rotaria sordida TaxID=392033 RepID=A0A819JFK8_9BILA|nr:unnamed protein product [Rotaria sordida]CAF3929290.1 unnamed protein product [Rotaria sordida]